MALDPPLQPLLRLENVVTKRRDRINADEEERLRLGYEIRTGVRFAERDGQPDARIAQVHRGDQTIARLTYAPSATLWRINLGWARRKHKHQYGFVLDIERGYWARNEQLEDDVTDPLSERTRRVIPYVEDSRNCLLLEPTIPLGVEQMASLQAALKRAIEAVFQLEDNELAAEPLPDADSRRVLLFYEASEGGAGVLRQLVDDPAALARVAREALRICHYDPDTGEDLHHAPRAREDCEAACYDCLLNYGNQREHPMLDRQVIHDLLSTLTVVEVLSSPISTTRQTFVETLLRQCESDLERDWLRYLHEQGYRLPNRAQTYIDTCWTRPDFVYEGDGVYAAIYVDGAPHDYPHRQARDRQQSECMEDYGYRVIRFGYRQNWEETLQAHRYVFGGEP